MIKAAIIFPFFFSDVHRKAALEWLRENYKRNIPDLTQVVGEDFPLRREKGKDRWIKALAVERAVRRVQDADVLVISDADVLIECRFLLEAIERVGSGQANWSTPFRKIFRLTEAATRRVFSENRCPFEIAKEPNALLERPYTHEAAGGVIVIRAATWRETPLDPNFLGFGSEDYAWADALNLFCGPRESIAQSDLIHFYHPPQVRMSRSMGSRASLDLRIAYRRSKFSVPGMEALLARAKAETQRLLLKEGDSRESHYG